MRLFIRYRRVRQLSVVGKLLIVAQVASSVKPLAMTWGPLAKLASSAAQAAKNIRSDLWKRQRPLKQRKSRSLKQEPMPELPAQKGPRVCPRRPIFEHGPCFSREVPRFATEAHLTTAADGGSAPKLDTSLPCLLSDKESAAAKVSALSLMRDSAAAFAAVWKKSPLRANPGRAVMKLIAPASDIAAAALAASLARSTVPIDASEALSATLAPGAFAVAAGSQTAFAEMDGMPSLRVASAGTRVVVLMPVAAVRACMSAGAAGPPVADSIDKLSQFLLNLTREAVADAANRFPIYSCTMMPGELLYTPANWITCESVLSSQPARDVRSPGDWPFRRAAATATNRQQQTWGSFGQHSCDLC